MSWKVNLKRTRAVWTDPGGKEWAAYWAINSDHALLWPIAGDRQGEPVELSLVQMISGGWHAPRGNGRNNE